MAVLTITIGTEEDSKKYSTSRISAYYVGKINKMQAATTKFAIEAKKIREKDVGLEDVALIYENIGKLSDEKSNLVCEVFGNRFTIDELEKGCTIQEINQIIKDMQDFVNGVLGKN